ncbi:hypothetical protein [Brevundimonas lenta]|uniref:Uncharacterized protein n=1 Tax=Brevundimonas lenta TaxID=424796 RepID=A0A7W6JDB1_9CAUL|nr:hypothetical protein [Brevundimonas lenta]MBB4083035.1 hypothetical protein [Brevundimonas lenta]
MYRITAVVVALLLCATGAQAASGQASDNAARTAAAHRLMDPVIEGMMRAPLEALWTGMDQTGYAPEEVAVMSTTFHLEVDGVIRTVQDEMAAAVVLHVPLDQINDNADFNSPAWSAVGESLGRAMEGRGQKIGLEMMMRVYEKGCAARSDPSPTCRQTLERVAEYRSGRVTAEDILGR